MEFIFSRSRIKIELSAGARPPSWTQINLPIFIVIFFFLAFNFSYADPLKATIDPSELAAGSRPLGLGRAYVGLADDVYAMFQNPAGLARIKNWQVASMYCRLIEEVDYNLLGVVHSMDRETVGIGYVQAAVSGSWLTRRDPVTDRIVPVGEGAIGYTSSVLFFPYAVSPEKYFPWPILKNLRLGASLKVFNQSLTGLPTKDVSALGYDLDVGVHYSPLSWLSLGFAGYNVLPYTLGGRLMWGSGIEESIPASAKAGCALKLIGAGGMKEFIFYPQELLLSYDYEFTFSGQRPALNHLGLEWRPHEILSLRVGLDQDAAATGGGATGIDNNLSAGVGLALFNLRFDYAFHAFGTLSENDTHFLSITYGIERKKLPAYAPPGPEAYFEITEPAERLVTFAHYVAIKGRVLLPENVEEVKVNQLVANFYPDNSFFAVAKLSEYGVNTLEVKVVSITGRILESKCLTIIRLVSFVDIGEGHPLRFKLGGLAALGYVSGFKDGRFRPEGYITRAELCALLIRIKATREVEGARSRFFKDISVRHWAAGYIAEAVKAKIVRGFPDGNFRPVNGATRAQAVSVFARFAGLEEPSYIYERPFPDVDFRHWAAKAIHAAKKRGYLDYLKGMSFRPNRKITRGEAIEILSKIDLVKAKLKNLIE